MPYFRELAEVFGHFHIAPDMRMTADQLVVQRPQQVRHRELALIDRDLRMQQNL